MSLERTNRPKAIVRANEKLGMAETTRTTLTELTDHLGLTANS
jgi:hypothetical protein